MITQIIALGPYHFCRTTVYLHRCQVCSIDQHSENMTIHAVQPVSTSSRITYAATAGFLGERSTLCGVQCKKLPNEVESTCDTESFWYLHPVPVLPSSLRHAQSKQRLMLEACASKGGPHSPVFPFPTWGSHKLSLFFSGSPSLLPPSLLCWLAAH